MITALLRSRLAIVLVALAFTLLLISAPGPKFTPNDKAFYADEKTVNFVRPGLVVDIQSATIAQDGTIRTRVKVTDPRGLPLDRLGIQTPGNVSLSFIAAFIPRGQKQYIAYTTRTQVSTFDRGTQPFRQRARTTARSVLSQRASTSMSSEPRRRPIWIARRRTRSAFIQAAT
jgi:hypothetical protein